MSCPLVPALRLQPLLQAMQVDLRIPAPQFRDVGHEACFIEPAEHLVKLLAQCQPHHCHRESLKPHRLTKDFAEHQRCFKVRQLASGNLEFYLYKVPGTRECKSSERPYIIGRYCLIGLVTANSIHELSLQKTDLDL